MHDVPDALLLAGPMLALSPVASVMLWLGILLGAVLVGGFVLLFFRRSILDSDSSQTPMGFDLRSLRQLRDRGEITEQEFEAARAGILGALSGETRSDPAAPLRPPTPETGEEIRAKPGFDLTGERLPGFDESDASGAESDDDEQPRQRPEK